jgi:tripartite-type tricarboxylate transporter receptor subunit TctC
MSVLPDVATLQEQGATSRAHTLMTFQCCVAPVATSPEIVRKLSELFVAAGKSDKIQEMLKSQGLDEAAMPLEESQRIYKEEAPIWRELIAALNLSPM